MNVFANAIANTATTTRTENGDVTYSTSLSNTVDMFFKIAAIRGQGFDRVKEIFLPAYNEDADIATRIALWVRDVRGGAGERQVFRDILKILEEYDTDRLMRILPIVAEVGRFDDLFVFKTQKVKEAVYTILAKALVDGDKADSILQKIDSLSEEDAKILCEEYGIC